MKSLLLFMAISCNILLSFHMATIEETTGIPVWNSVLNVWENLLLTRQPSKNEPVPMKIIGAGFGRTGSNSLMIALEKLGYKTYHMEHAFSLHHLADWGLVNVPGSGPAGQNNTALDLVLDKIAEAGFTSGVDFPICCFYKELARRHPDSPVILSVRSSPQVWAKSFFDTIYSTRGLLMKKRPTLTGRMAGFPDAIDMMNMKCGMPPHEEQTPENVAEAYSRWIEDVRATVPPSKLLVFNVKDGWEPLCIFLKIPAAKCPNHNGEDFARAKKDTADLQFALKLLTCLIVGPVVLSIAVRLLVLFHPMLVAVICLVCVVLRWVFGALLHPA